MSILNAIIGGWQRYYTLTGWAGVFAAIAITLILIGGIDTLIGRIGRKSEPATDPGPVLSQDEEDALSNWYVCHADAQADVAYARGEMLAESEEEHG